MKAKKHKSAMRVYVNTGLLVLLAIAIGLMTFCGVQKLEMLHKNFTGISDVPGLCYDEERYRKNQTIENAYPCLTQTDEDGNPIPATSQNDQTIFLFNHTSFSSSVLSHEFIIVLTVVGGIFTLTSLIAALVYWNHNRDSSL